MSPYFKPWRTHFCTEKEIVDSLKHPEAKTLDEAMGKEGEIVNTIKQIALAIRMIPKEEAIE